MLVYCFVLFIVSNRYLLFIVSNGHNSITVQNRTHVFMSFFHHKDLGNHLLQLCPKVVKHPVYSGLLGWGAEQFPLFWKCYNPSKQWNLLTQRYRIQLIIFKCKQLLFNCTIFVWHVHTLSTYKLTNKTKKLMFRCKHY